MSSGTTITVLNIGSGGGGGFRQPNDGSPSSFTYNGITVTGNGGMGSITASIIGGIAGPGNDMTKGAGNGGNGATTTTDSTNGNSNTNICGGGINEGGIAGTSDIYSSVIGGGGGGASIIANGANGGNANFNSGMNALAGSGTGGGGGAVIGNTGFIGGNGGSGNVIVQYNTCPCS